MKPVTNGPPTSSKDAQNHQREPHPTFIIIERPLPSTILHLPCGCEDAIRDLEQGQYEPYSPSVTVNQSLIEVKAAEADEDGWIAHGEGRLGERRCPTCGVMYQTILESIPVHFASFACPTCHDSGKIFSYEVKRIACLNAFEFAFEARIVCEGCKNKKTLRTILKNILKIVNIEVGPTGVTLKNAPSSRQHMLPFREGCY